MLPSPSAEPGTRKLSEVARRVVAPSSIVDSAWFDLERTFVKLGIGFDGWQDGAGQLILGLDSSGKYACTVGGACLCLPRQVGKTYLIGNLCFALCVRFPGLLVIWTAHHGDTAAETFSAMYGMSQRQKILPHVRKTFNSDNHKEIIFRNGSRILFGARARGFGRGIPGVDVLVCDEAQNLPERAVDDMLATLNTSKNGLPIFLGTPPTPLDASDAWRRMRDDAASGESDDTVWIECGADPDADPNDRDQLAKANPSYPHRTPWSSILRLKKRSSPESWLREGLGIWDEDASVFPLWSTYRGDRPPGLAVGALAVAAEVEQRHCSITVAGVYGERAFVRSLQYGPGIGWAVGAIRGWHRRFRVPVLVSRTGPASSLIDQLTNVGVDVQVVQPDDEYNAAPQFSRLVLDGLLSHAGDSELDNAVRAAVKQTSGDRWRWARRRSAADISPLEGVTLATWGAVTPQPGQLTRVRGSVHTQ